MLALRLARAFWTGTAIGIAWAVTEHWLREREGSHAQAIYQRVMAADGTE